MPKIYQLDLNFLDFLNSLKFDSFVTRNKRYTAYYSNLPYSYGKTKHYPQTFSSNIYIVKLSSLINNLFPTITQ